MMGLGVIFSFIALWADQDYAIFVTENRELIDLPELAERLFQNDVIFFGEFHENSVLHHIQLELFREIYNISSAVALSMEMFERDVQPYLDAYLNNEIDAAEFQDHTRPWVNYDPDYKDLIEFARDHGLPVIAANVPRRYAASVHERGSAVLQTIPPAERIYFAASLRVINDEYRTRFINVMEENKFHGGMSLPGQQLDNLYAAQCLKDDTMAESIVNFMLKNPEKKVIHITGDFHSNSRLGTVQKTIFLSPELKIAVITPVINEKENMIFPEEKASSGDYIILLRQ